MRKQRFGRFAFLLALGTGVLGASTFQNGGFESPVLASSPDFSAVPTGWTKFDPSCGGTANCAGTGLFMQTYLTFGLPTVGGDPPQAFGFGGNGVLSGSLLQTFDTTPGATYHVSFKFAIQQGSGFEDLVADVLNGAVSGVSTATFGCSGAGCLATTGGISFRNLAWGTTSLDFTAAGTSTTLRFSDFSGVVESVNDEATTNWALDAVSVTQTGVGAAPEPATWGLVASAIGALGFLRRRRMRTRI